MDEGDDLGEGVDSGSGVCLAFLLAFRLFKRRLAFAFSIAFFVDFLRAFAADAADDGVRLVDSTVDSAGVVGTDGRSGMNGTKVKG